MTSVDKLWLAVTAAIALCALSACGGGGSSGDTSGSGGTTTGGSGGSGGNGGSSGNGGSGGSAPPISFAAAPGKSGVVGKPIDVRPAVTLAGITSCDIKPGSANEQIFVAAGFTVDDTSCAIGGTPQASLPPTLFTITATAATATEDAEVTLAVTLPRSTFAFVAQHGLDSIAVYSVDGATGAMSLASVATTGAGSRPHAVIADPERRFLYVANSGTAEIARFAIDASDGALTALPATPTSGTPLMLAIDPVGRFLFVLHGGTDDVLKSYRIDPSDGSLTVADEEATLNEPIDVAVDRTGRFLYVASYGGFFRMAVDQTTGAVSSQRAVSHLSSLAFPPSNGGLYAASAQTQSVWYYPDANAGALTNSRLWDHFVQPAMPLRALAFDPEGRFLYAAVAANSLVVSLAVDPATGEIALAGSIALPAGCNPHALSVDPGGRFLRAACSDASGKIVTLAAARASGTLTLASEVAVAGAEPKSIETVNLRNRFLYAADAATSALDVYSIDASTGELHADAPPRTTQTAPAALTTDRTGAHLYAVAIDGSIDAYSIDPTGGELAPAGAAVNGGHVDAAVVIGPGGRFAYAPNRAANTISRYAIDPATGELGTRIDLAVIASPNGIAFHPSERNAYVIGDGAQGLIRVYDVDPTTGYLMPYAGIFIATFSLQGLPTGITMDPTGRFVYVGLAGSHTVAGFTVDAEDGRLFPTTQSSTGGIDFGFPASALRVDPTGRYLYVTSSSTGEIAVFEIARGEGELDPGRLTPIGNRALSGPASSLLLDSTGRALYAAIDGATPALAVVPIDRALTEIGAAVPTAVAAHATGIAIAP